MSNEYVSYLDCPVLCKIKKSKTPLISNVDVDDFTKSVENNFDYKFTGESKFYPFELPSIINNIDFNILCIVGASGSGKSTLLKQFNEDYSSFRNNYDNTKAIISNFNNIEDGTGKLSVVGLNSIPVWCKPRNVLSVGEGFRADIALNLDSYTIFDEFTSTIDRNVAKFTCNGLNRYIHDNELHNIVFSSCHKDFIPYLKPDIVIDLDEENIYDCRGKCLGKTYRYKSTSQMQR